MLPVLHLCFSIARSCMSREMNLHDVRRRLKQLPIDHKVKKEVPVLNEVFIT